MSRRRPEFERQLTKAARLFDTDLHPTELAAALGNSSTALESVPAAIYAAAVHESVEEAITFAVRCGGDTDTIAALAGAITGAHAGARDPGPLARRVRGRPETTQPRRASRRTARRCTRPLNASLAVALTPATQASPETHARLKPTAIGYPRRSQYPIPPRKIANSNKPQSKPGDRKSACFQGFGPS